MASGAGLSGAGGADGCHAIGHSRAERRAGVAIRRDATAQCGGGGQEVAGGVCVRGGLAGCFFSGAGKLLLNQLDCRH